jgi:hypothetical protein
VHGEEQGPSGERAGMTVRMEDAGGGRDAGVEEGVEDEVRGEGGFERGPGGGRGEGGRAKTPPLPAEVEAELARFGYGMGVEYTEESRTNALLNLSDDDWREANVGMEGWTVRKGRGRESAMGEDLRRTSGQRARTARGEGGWAGASHSGMRVGKDGGETGRIEKGEEEGKGEGEGEGKGEGGGDGGDGVEEGQPARVVVQVKVWIDFAD